MSIRIAAGVASSTVQGIGGYVGKRYLGTEAPGPSQWKVAAAFDKIYKYRHDCLEKNDKLCKCARKIAEEANLSKEDAKFALYQPLRKVWERRVQIEKEMLSKGQG